MDGTFKNYVNMEKIIQTIESLPKKRFTGAVSDELIVNAEKQLGVSFSPEYKVFLKSFGSLLAKGEEIIGVTGKNNNVVEATITARSESDNFPKGMYVISKCGVDGILLVQNPQGNVFSYQANSFLQKLGNSLSEYLESL